MQTHACDHQWTELRKQTVVTCAIADVQGNEKQRCGVYDSNFNASLAKKQCDVIAEEHSQSVVYSNKHKVYCAVLLNVTLLRKETPPIEGFLVQAFHGLLISGQSIVHSNLLFLQPPPPHTARSGPDRLWIRLKQLAKDWTWQHQVTWPFAAKETKRKTARCVICFCDQRELIACMRENRIRGKKQMMRTVGIR